MSYNKKAVRACMPTQLEQECGAGGGALLHPHLSFKPSHPPCIKLEREKGEEEAFPLLIYFTVPLPNSLCISLFRFTICDMYLVCVARLRVPHSHTTQERRGWRTAPPVPEEGEFLR